MTSPTVTEADIVSEIRTLVEEGIEQGQVQRPALIVQAIVDEHPDITGDDKDFYLRCAYQHIRDAVRKVLSDYKAHPGPTNQQMKLDGFEYLQKAYLLEREDEQAIVPIEVMTNEEFLTKINEYRTMAEGCIKHHDELERYRQERFQEQ